MKPSYILIRELPGVSSGTRGTYAQDIGKWSFGRYYFHPHELETFRGFFVVEKSREHYEWLRGRCGDKAERIPFLPSASCPCCGAKESENPNNK
jgi:hypothetical protein